MAERAASNPSPRTLIERLLCPQCKGWTTERTSTGNGFCRKCGCIFSVGEVLAITQAELDALLREVEQDRHQDRPKVICLCGSTRFIEQFAVQTWELERQGHIVLGCTLLPMWYCQAPSHFGEATGTKAQCDERHKRKIDLADEVLVLDIDGYIGESTRDEIEYAIGLGKAVRYFSETSAPAVAERPQPTAHTLTLQFGRFLTESEWRDVAEKARKLPFVQGMEANAVAEKPEQDQEVIDRAESRLKALAEEGRAHVYDSDWRDKHGDVSHFDGPDPDCSDCDRIFGEANLLRDLLVVAVRPHPQEQK